VAKKESSHYLKVDGLAPIGGLWATRFECVPVENRRHHLGGGVYLEAREERGSDLAVGALVGRSYLWAWMQTS
jgi:hypothetical protein